MQVSEGLIEGSVSYRDLKSSPQTSSLFVACIFVGFGINKSLRETTCFEPPACFHMRCQRRILGVRWGY